MQGKTKTLFHVVDAGGSDYYVAADDFAEAYHRFRKWERGDDPEEYDEPQVVRSAGELIVE